MIELRALGLCIVTVGLTLGLGCGSEDVNLTGMDGSVGTDAGAFDGARPDAGPTDGSVGTDASAPPIPGLLALRVDPASARVVDDGVAPGETAPYRALGMFATGERDVTDMVAWSVADPALGTVVGGVFTSAGVGGMSRVVAAAGAISATADITVSLEVVVVSPGAPADAAARFAADPAGDRLGDTNGPRVIYPSHETMFPQNLSRVLPQWRSGASVDLFELRFDSPVARVRFYTTARSLLVDGDAWHWLAASHAGGSLTMTVRGLSTAMPATIYRSQDVTLYFSRAEVIGALYYWSTGAAGVMRATISSPLATKFYANPDIPDDTCVSCHTVSRDGRRLYVNYGGELAHVATIPEREVRIPAPPSTAMDPGGWATFNPGATRVLIASRGLMRLVDTETGAALGAVTLPAMTFATHPDWSPDGRYVAVVISSRAPGNKSCRGTSLARMAVMPDGTFGAPEVLVASTSDDDTMAFPSYSPDSRWIAFSRMVGASKDNRTSVLYLMAADGSGAPIPLTRLNQRVRDADGVVDIGNNMPTWAPSTSPDIFWLAVSSLRAYGDVIAAGGRDQLWGVAIDPARIGAGDPSYAAFWMPFQDIDEGNHRAFWALNPDDRCPSTVEICDGLDNDCDGIVDEMCCTPATEVCGDRVDNDCDGEADEGCACMPVPENCTNGVDDDCDGLIDALDEDCIII